MTCSVYNRLLEGQARQLSSIYFSTNRKLIRYPGLLYGDMSVLGMTPT